MYTQCPRCRTVFAVTEAQLGARAGMVRCGRCRNVFQADMALFDGPPSLQDTPRLEPSFAESVLEPLIAIDPAAAEEGIPRRRWPWRLGVLLLTLTLAVQILYANRGQILSARRWQPTLAALCQRFGWQLSWPENIREIALRRVSVTAHPRYRGALQVAFTLVNGAATPQPYPNIQLTLINPTGQVLARRTFSPKTYGQEDPRGRLTPHVATRMHFGITRPPNTPTVGLSYALELFPRNAHLP